MELVQSLKLVVVDCFGAGVTSGHAEDHPVKFGLHLAVDDAYHVGDSSGLDVVLN